jgi:tripartite-type tricarboxylate transporter receptor subunit TctC
LLPKGTSREIVTRLQTEIVKAMNTPDVRAKLAAHGFDTGGSTPEQFGAFRKAEEARWGRVIKEAGISQE